MLSWLSIGLATYAIGAFPTGYLLCRLLRGQDIRRLGDGNPGAENVFRHVGHMAGVVTGAVDIGKGTLAVLVARLLGGPGTPEMFGGVMAVAGHSWPLFLHLRGGRGAATALGVLLALLPGVTLPLGMVTLGVLLISESTTVALATFFVPLSLVFWYAQASGVLIGYAIALPVMVGISHYLSLSRVPTAPEGPPAWDQKVRPT